MARRGSGRRSQKHTRGHATTRRNPPQDIHAPKPKRVNVAREKVKAEIAANQRRKANAKSKRVEKQGKPVSRGENAPVQLKAPPTIEGQILNTMTYARQADILSVESLYRRCAELVLQAGETSEDIPYARRPGWEMSTFQAHQTIANSLGMIKDGRSPHSWWVFLDAINVLIDDMPNHVDSFTALKGTKPSKSRRYR